LHIIRNYNADSQPQTNIPRFATGEECQGHVETD
jgi:hypothetical protein